MPDVVPVIALVMVFGVPIVAIIGYYCHLCWKQWLDTSLKRDMVARGYTAQEIIAILAADKSSDSHAELSDVPPAKPVKQPAYSP